MKELQECWELKKEINKLDEKILKLRTVIFSPKNQVITGMPRGGRTENAMERYLIKIENIEQKKDVLLIAQKEKWNIALSKLGDITEEERELLYIRFVKGLPWKKCEYQMQSKYGGWNENRVFRTYRKLKNIV